MAVRQTAAGLSRRQHHSAKFQNGHTGTMYTRGLNDLNRLRTARLNKLSTSFCCCLISCFFSGSCSAPDRGVGRAGGRGDGEVLQGRQHHRADLSRGARRGSAARVHHLAPRGPHAQLRHGARRHQVHMNPSSVTFSGDSQPDFKSWLFPW